MRHITWKQILAILLATLTLLLSACTPDDPAVDTTTEAPADDDTTTTDGGDGETTTAPDDDPGDDIPTVNSSKELLTFTPASPDKLVLDEEGNCAPSVIEHYNEMAIDDLGRPMVTYEDTGLPNAKKWVGIFYSIWTASVGGSVKSHIDVSKALASDPEDPFYGPLGNFCWWSEPETGYHAADDVWQIRRDMRYLSMLGVDFIFLDFTNGFLYADCFKVLLDTMAEMRAEGQMTPYVVPWIYDSGGTLMERLDTEFYNQDKYKHLWFRWEGKPLVLIKRKDGNYPSREKVPTLYNEDYMSRYTVRLMWGDYNWPADLRPEGVGSNANYKKWTYNGGWSTSPAAPEVVSIGLAGFAEYGTGRSGPMSTIHHVDDFLETPTMGEGIYFKRDYDKAMLTHSHAEIMLVSRWNEWTAQNGHALDFGFVDQFNPEFSRDIEPMKGGYTDNYFYQFCNMVRQFKGVLPAEGTTGAQTMDVNTGDFEKWEKIMPVFTDYALDTKWRNFTDPTGEIKYIDSTGRHDIVESRLTADGGMVYAYVRCAEKISSYNRNPNWMMLFIDADQNKETGWEGYDFVINYKVLDNVATTICAYKDNVWQEIGVVQYKRENDRMMIAIPRSLLGLTGDKVAVDFHWMDNVTDIYDLHSWFTTGDSAPERRNNYTISLDVAYDASAETVIPGRTEGALTYMPAVTMTAGQESRLKSGLDLSVYRLPVLHDDDGNRKNYSKMPEVYKLEENLIVTMPSDVINANIGFRTANFALSYDGYIKIPEDGDHRFRIAADDGALLYIDGRLVAEVPYDAERGADEVAIGAGNIRLAAGYHTFKLEYAEVGNGSAELALEGDWELYRSDETGASTDIDVSYDTSIESVEMDLVTLVEGKALVGGSRISNVYSGAVLGLGQWDLSKYASVEIDYCSDAKAMLGDKGSFFAISYSVDPVKDANGHPYVLSTGEMTNAAGAWDKDIRTAVIDLSDVAYGGEIYLASYIGSNDGVTVSAIRFIKAETPTPMPEGGYPEPPVPPQKMDLTTVTSVEGTANVGGTRISNVYAGTVLGLGQWNLADYDAIEIVYCSASKATLGTSGSFFAISYSTDPVKTSEGHAYVLGTGAMTNPQADWAGDERTAVIDLSTVAYEGEIYLAPYINENNSVTIASIRLIKAETPTPMPEGGYPAPPAPAEKMDLTTVTTVNGTATVKDGKLSNVLAQSVIGLGSWNLAEYDTIEIEYASAATAMLGDKGSFFAISYSTDPVKDAAGHDYVLATAAMTNAQGDWAADTRTAVIDLSTVAYEGEIYLAPYIGDNNGVTIYAIRLTKAETPTPMPEGGYPAPPVPAEKMDLSTFTTVNGKATVSNGKIGDVFAQAVIGMGSLDLAGYAAMEIDYCSDASAMLGDAGSFFAISYSTDPVTDADGHDYVLGTAAMTNAQGAWAADIRTATVDLSTVAYAGEIYLAPYMATNHGVTVMEIRLIPAETPTPMPEGGYPAPTTGEGA